MNLKKAPYLFVCGICMWALMNCGEGKYADAKKVTIKYLDAMENFANAVDKAGGPEALVRAVDKFTGEMERLRPEMESIERKYPELTNTATPPAEMEDLAQRMNMLSQRLLAAQNKLVQYSSDPDVQSAIQKLQTIK